MSWENLIKDQSLFPLVIILFVLITLSLDNVWISLGENWFWSLLGLKGLTGTQWFWAGTHDYHKMSPRTHHNFLSQNHWVSSVQSFQCSRNYVQLWKVVTWIAVCEKRANWEKNFRDGERWTPAVFENVQTYYTLKCTSDTFNHRLSTRMSLRPFGNLMI